MAAGDGVAFTEEGRALLALGRRGVKWVETNLDSSTTVSVVQALIDYVDDIVSTVE